MKILVIGNGSGAHALIWKLKQEPVIKKIFCTIGNAGICELAISIPISPVDIPGLMQFADKNHIDLTIVSTEEPLFAGIVDSFQSQGLLIFGPTQRASKIMTSRKYAKYICRQYHIPTAKYTLFDDYYSAKKYIEKTTIPVVIKTETYIGDKSALVCNTRNEALLALKEIMSDGIFGDAGQKIIIEEYLSGDNVSLSVFTDGIQTLATPYTRIYKNLFDQGKGLLTKGLGAYSPVLTSKKLNKAICEDIILPVIRGMALENSPYRGVLHTNMIITKTGPYVTSFKCFFDDPSAETLLPLMESPVSGILKTCAESQFKKSELQFSDKCSVSVVMTSGGNPYTFSGSKNILGLTSKLDDNILTFHSGTKREKGYYKTTDNRVLTVTAIDNSIHAAYKNVYKIIGKITFDGAYYRKDIALEA